MSIEGRREIILILRVLWRQEVHELPLLRGRTHTASFPNSHTIYTFLRSVNLIIDLVHTSILYFVFWLKSLVLMLLQFNLIPRLPLTLSIAQRVSTPLHQHLRGLVAASSEPGALDNARYQSVRNLCLFAEREFLKPLR